jgi:hypothetical protein
VNQESSLVNTLYLVGMPKQVGHADDLSSELRSALADARVSRRHTHGLVLLPTLKIDSELHTKVDEFLPLGTPVPRQTSRSQTSVGVGLKVPHVLASVCSSPSLTLHGRVPLVSQLSWADISSLRASGRVALVLLEIPLTIH